MSYSSISDDIPFEGRDISVEEFWKTEILSSYNSKIDLDFIAVSNRDLHPLTVHIEFRKFLGFVNDALHKDVFRDLLMPVFRHLYLLLLSSKGKSEAVKFYRSYSYLFSSSDGLQDLLKCETCEDAQVFLKSLSRMRVKLSKRAYTTLSNWLKGNFSESSEMFNIPRVLHENFHIDIYNGKEEEALFLDEKKILEKVQSLNKNFQIPEAPKNSEHKTKDTAKASSKIQTGETQRARKKYEPKADTCKATKKDSKKAYLEKVKNSGKSIEEMVEALLNPPDSFDDSSSENSDQIMNSDEDPGEEDPGKKIIEDDTGNLLEKFVFKVCHIIYLLYTFLTFYDNLIPILSVTENSDLIMNSDEDPGEEDPGKKIIEDDTGEPLGEDGVQRGRHYKIQPQRFQLPDNYKTNFHRSLAYTISGKDIVCSSDISPDLLYMAVGFENCKIRTWRFINNNTKFQPIGTLVGHEKIVCALSIDSNRKCLISGSHDYSVKIWDIEKSICMKSLKPHSAPVLDVCIRMELSLINLFKPYLLHSKAVGKCQQLLKRVFDKHTRTAMAMKS
ncbi:Zinc finger CCCH domain-containing protein 17 [Argiope bruennichi]|uniref:Zinc finger CCCH domain-containing protein 17 n=1 Tax=Argiope bruennichi TaxID=94029 RepID=A0A8T0F6R5_ARGBR|nr:Zinc finger CCCH domain-containing protein 17 [Argiope bruennichi]